MADRIDALARHVADTVDAWLRDPRDVEVYRRLVEAAEQWRAHRYPQLPGTERYGRRGGPAAVDEPTAPGLPAGAVAGGSGDDPGSLSGAQQLADQAEESGSEPAGDPQHAPARLGDVLADLPLRPPDT